MGRWSVKSVKGNMKRIAREGREGERLGGKGKGERRKEGRGRVSAIRCITS